MEKLFNSIWCFKQSIFFIINKIKIREITKKIVLIIPLLKRKLKIEIVLSIVKYILINIRNYIIFGILKTNHGHTNLCNKKQKTKMKLKLQLLKLILKY